ncbi:DUF2878 family protein [Agarivorans sp. 1_MG-2023]|uniref:DUF2878 family protein n=1 Tax=Agarivorans sp. 1_MG-2023 TaxID=3062634 RepID=UPI0026E3D004|nr:DUF2878 family protein [Agarivorans sp. 1_MG-2023]MDO6762651.1 DUF2878 family protein [Agarivorans sp. 1_MG-2023]
MQWPVLLVFKLNWFAAFFWGEQAVWFMLLGLVALALLQVRNYQWAVLVPCAMLSVVGVIIDIALVEFGVLSFSSPNLPVFMMLLWASFALLLPTLASLPKPFMPIFVAIMGPVSYYLASLADVFTLEPGLWLGLIILLPLWSVFAYLANSLLEKRYV